MANYINTKAIDLILKHLNEGSSIRDIYKSLVSEENKLFSKSEPSLRNYINRDFKKQANNEGNLEWMYIGDLHKGYNARVSQTSLFDNAKNDSTGDFKPENKIETNPFDVNQETPVAIKSGDPKEKIIQHLIKDNNYDLKASQGQELSLEVLNENIIGAMFKLEKLENRIENFIARMDEQNKASREFQKQLINSIISILSDLNY